MTQESIARRRDRPSRLVSTLSLSSAALAGWLYVKPRRGSLTTGLIGYALKILTAALAPFVALSGLIGALLSRRRRHPIAGYVGAAGAVLAGRFIRRVSAPHDGFEEAFGPGWETHLPKPDGSPPWLTKRWRLGQVGIRPRPQHIRNLTFATVPDAERPLLCDLWLPATGVRHSRLGFIFLHGGGWQAFDKDLLTRPFFRHLATQGHVVMDVAYRLAREADMRGMVGDVKRAVAWLKRHGPSIGVDPAKIVLAGGSAGGHLALLAAYTPCDPDFDPPDVRDTNTAVRGVVAYYPVADLRTLSHHWSQQSMHPLATAMGKAVGYFSREGYQPWSKLVRKLFGAPLDAVPDELLRFSPIAHVGAHCPPTLILQGLHDHIIPVEDVRTLHRALHDAGRPAVLVELPQVEHAFDLIAPQVSPPAQAALYDVDRFLALMARGG
ncbi:MAG: alpha/beta hydrolase [Anaerolineae bacterium]